MFYNDHGQTFYEPGEIAIIRYARAIGNFDKPVFVENRTGAPLWHRDAVKIAERAATSPLFFNNCTCRYWMFDFSVYNFWCEMTQPDDVSPYDELHIAATGHAW